MNDDARYLGVPDGTLNTIVAYLMQQPYQEVAEILKALESEVITINSVTTEPTTEEIPSE